MLLTARAYLDLRQPRLLAERMKRNLEAPTRDESGLGAGLQAAVHIYAGAMRRRYSTNAAGGGDWPALRPATIRRKRRLTAWPERILYLTGAAYSSLTPGEPGNVINVARDRITYGSNVHHLRHHQKGGSGLPQRRILVEPTAELLAQCIAPIRDGWRRAMENHVAAARMVA